MQLMGLVKSGELSVSGCHDSINSTELTRWNFCRFAHAYNKPITQYYI